MSAAVADLGRVAERIYGADGFVTISRFRDILASRGIEWGLLGPREVPRLWDRHILNSAAVATLIPERATVADVGSGAGLPGIPVAVLRPDLAVDLIEPLLRRSKFLTHTVDDLGITGRVAVRRQRADEVDHTYDAVLSRALAPLDRLIGWCRPLLAPGGSILALKGSSAEREVAESSRLLASSGLRAEVTAVRLDPAVSTATVVIVTAR